MSFNLNSPGVQQIFAQNPAGVPGGAGGYYGPPPQATTETIASSLYSLVDVSPYPTPAQMTAQNQFAQYPYLNNYMNNPAPQQVTYDAYSAGQITQKEESRQFCDPSEVVFTPAPTPPKPEPKPQPQPQAVGYAPPIQFNNPTQYQPPVQQQTPPQNSWTDMGSGRITLGQAVPMPVLQLGGAMAPGGGMFHDMTQPVPLPQGYSNPYLGQGPYGGLPNTGYGGSFFSPVTRQYAPDGNSGLDYYLANYHNRPVNPYDINDPRNSALFSDTIIDRALKYRYADAEDRQAMDNGFESMQAMMENQITIEARLAIIAAKGAGHPEREEEIILNAKAKYEQFLQERGKRIEQNKKMQNPFAAYAQDFGKEDEKAYHPHVMIKRGNKIIAEVNNPEDPSTIIKAVSVRDSNMLVDSLEKARATREQVAAQQEIYFAQKYASAPERKLDHVSNVVDAFNEINYLMIMDKFSDLTAKQRERRKGKIDAVDYRIELRLSEYADPAQRAAMRKILEAQREKEEQESARRKAAMEGGYDYTPPSQQSGMLSSLVRDSISRAEDGGLSISLPPRMGDQMAELHQTPFQATMTRARMEFIRRAGEGV